MFQKHIVLIVALAFSSASHAGGVLPYTSIDNVGFQTGGFFLYGNWANPNSCTRSDAVVLLDTDVNYDKAYALLLTAFASGKQVYGYSEGCTDFDGQTYNTIRGFKYLRVK